MIFIISACAPSQLLQCQQGNAAYSINEAVLKLGAFDGTEELHLIDFNTILTACLLHVFLSCLYTNLIHQVTRIRRKVEIKKGIGETRRNEKME